MVKELWIEIKCYMSLYAKINIDVEHIKANSSTSVYSNLLALISIIIFIRNR
jgi:hypothetical protein